MSCKKLDITSYFRLIPTTGNPDMHTVYSAGTSETAYSRFKPVVSVSILNYRYYSSERGRWLNRDPIWELAFQMVQGQKEPENFSTLYDFLSNTPVNYSDRLGLEKMYELLSSSLNPLVKGDQCDSWVLKLTWKDTETNRVWTETFTGSACDLREELNKWSGSPYHWW